MKDFTVKQKTFRVIAQRRMEYHRGYVGKYEMFYNLLQRQINFLGFKFWKTIQEESIPNFAVIEQGCLGSTSWSSPLLQTINNKTHPIFMS